MSVTEWQRLDYAGLLRLPQMKKRSESLMAVMRVMKEDGRKSGIKYLAVVTGTQLREEGLDNDDRA